MTAEGPQRRTRRGRGRPGGSVEDSRRAVLHAARVTFARYPFEQATIRSIGESAGVDSAMVNHWFGGKRGLFLAATEFQLRTDELVQRVASGPRQRVGERLLRAFLTVADGHPLQMAILVRNMYSNGFASHAMHKLIDHGLLRPVVTELGVDARELRVDLCASQLMGLAAGRLDIRLHALAGLGTDDLVVAVAPTFQHYLDGPILRRWTHEGNLGRA